MFKLFREVAVEARRLLGRRQPTPTTRPRDVRDVGYLGDLRRPELPPFDLQVALSNLIFAQSRAIDTYFPNQTDEDRVVDTHVGPLTTTQSKQIAAALIAAAGTHGVDLPFITAVMFVNARWSPEAYDHGLRLGQAVFSFEQTRWGIGLFYGAELRRREEFRSHSEGYVLERVTDPQWAADAVAAELADDLQWAREYWPSHSWVLIDQVLEAAGLTDVADQEKEFWMAAAAFHLRDRHKALDLVWSKIDDPATLNYCSAVVGLTRKFRPQITEPSA